MSHPSNDHDSDTAPPQPDGERSDATPFADVEPSVQIDYMLRTAQQMHARFSQMADAKANIIIASSSVIFTIALSHMDSGRLSYALLLLAASSLGAAVLAIFAVMPHLNLLASKAPPKDSPDFNALFFGHFSQLSPEEYAKHMAELLRHSDTAYAAIIRDLYQQGRYLQQSKYYYLGLSYRVFLTGLTLALAVVVVQWLTG